MRFLPPFSQFCIIFPSEMYLNSGCYDLYLCYLYSSPAPIDVCPLTSAYSWFWPCWKLFAWPWPNSPYNWLKARPQTHTNTTHTQTQHTHLPTHRNNIHTHRNTHRTAKDNVIFFSWNVKSFSIYTPPQQQAPINTIDLQEVLVSHCPLCACVYVCALI